MYWIGYLKKMILLDFKLIYIMEQEICMEVIEFEVKT